MPVRIDDKTLSERYGLDQRTVHLLPAKSSDNVYPDRQAFIGPTASPSTHSQSSQIMSHYNNSGYKYPTSAYWRRYAAILEKKGARFFAKVVIQEELDAWAKKRGFVVLRQYRTYGTVNEKMEKTEFSRRGSK